MKEQRFLTPLNGIPSTPLKRAKKDQKFSLQSPDLGVEPKGKRRLRNAPPRRPSHDSDLLIRRQNQSYIFRFMHYSVHSATLSQLQCHRDAWQPTVRAPIYSTVLAGPASTNMRPYLETELVDDVHLGRSRCLKYSAHMRGAAIGSDSRQRLI